MLKGKLAENGYDWWWHSLIGKNKETMEKKPFFIEYFVINPALGADKPILGQKREYKQHSIRPSYAMLKAGAWGKDNSAQIHNFYGISDFSASRKKEYVRIGPYYATETRLKGAVKVTKKEKRQHPEWMSDAGEMRWNLRANKVLSYDTGFGTSKLMRDLNAFQMYWHVQGQLTRYKGKITFNGEEYIVEPETSCGYQDKNWGTDFSNPWIWLNCNHFTSHSTGERLPLTSLDIGGAQPVVFGVPIPRKLLISFYYKGRLYEFNFSKVWTHPQQKFNVKVTEDLVIWKIIAQNRRAKIKINFHCPKDHMLLFNYENPRGKKHHTKLWNGGHGRGWVKLYHRKNGDFTLVDTLDGKFAGCEYGKYEK